MRFAILVLFFSLFVNARIHHFQSAFAPEKNSVCPAGSLVRAAKGLSPPEKDYFKARRAKANDALVAWAKKINPAFGTVKPPVVGLATSGGGFRALLTSAGIIQAFDGRDGKAGTNGLYQGITYHSGLSGGGWLLSSLMGNDWPTISSLRDTLWKPTFGKGLIFESLNPRIQAEIAFKHREGSHSSLVNLYGRALSHMLLRGKHGGVEVTLSSVADKPSFKDHVVPYPIITAVEIDTTAGTCAAVPASLQYELHPFEFGSWEPSVRGFTPTKYLGTPVSNGKPSRAGKCTTNFDNLGYVLGTSSSLFNMVSSYLASHVRGTAMSANDSKLSANGNKGLFACVHENRGQTPRLAFPLDP